MSFAKEIFRPSLLYEYKAADRRICSIFTRISVSEQTAQKCFSQLSFLGDSLQDKIRVKRKSSLIMSSCRRKSNINFIKPTRSYHTGLKYMTKSFNPFLITLGWHGKITSGFFMFFPTETSFDGWTSAYHSWHAEQNLVFQPSTDMWSKLDYIW